MQHWRYRFDPSGWTLRSVFSLLFISFLFFACSSIRYTVSVHHFLLLNLHSSVFSLLAIINLKCSRLNQIERINTIRNAKEQSVTQQIFTVAESCFRTHFWLRNNWVRKLDTFCNSKSRKVRNPKKKMLKLCWWEGWIYMKNSRWTQRKTSSFASHQSAEKKFINQIIILSLNVHLFTHDIVPSMFFFPPDFYLISLDPYTHAHTHTTNLCIMEQFFGICVRPSRISVFIHKVKSRMADKECVRVSENESNANVRMSAKYSSTSKAI